MQLRLTTHEGVRQKLQLYPGMAGLWGSGYKNQAISGMVSGRITCNPVFPCKAGIRQELQFCPDDNRSAGKLVYKSDSIGMVFGRIMRKSGF